jgi:hypothetical protein
MVEMAAADRVLDVLGCVAAVSGAGDRAPALHFFGLLTFYALF